MSALPTLQEELDHKSFETIEWLLDQHQLGKLSTAQAATGVDALYMAVNGLVDEDIHRIVTGASGLLTEKARERLFLLKDDAAMLVEWEVGADSVRITAFNHGKVSGKSVKEFITPALAREGVLVIVDKLVHKGYVAI